MQIAILADFLCFCLVKFFLLAHHRFFSLHIRSVIKQTTICYSNVKTQIFCIYLFFFSEFSIQRMLKNYFAIISQLWSHSSNLLSFSAACLIPWSNILESNFSQASSRHVFTHCIVKNCSKTLSIADRLFIGQ